MNNILLIAAGIGLIILYGLFDPAKGGFPACPVRTLTGWLCPGCGSQRAIHQLLHGNLAVSFHYNPLFLPALFYGGIALGISILDPAKWQPVMERYYGVTAAYVSLGIILIFTVLRNVL